MKAMNTQAARDAQFAFTPKQAWSWSALLLGIGFLLWLLAPVLTPFVVAAVLAYALSPLVDRLERLGSGRFVRVLAVLLVELLCALVLLALLLLMVPVLASEVPQLRQQVPLLLDAWASALKALVAPFGFDLTLDLASIKAMLLSYLGANAESVMASALRSLRLGGGWAFVILGNLVLIPVVLFYLLLDWRALVARTVEFVPPRWRAAYDSFTAEADAVLGQYLRGQLLVMLVLAIYYSAALSLFGLDLALPIGIFTGLAVFVPYLGFGLGLMLAAVAGLLQFALTAGLTQVVVMIAVVFGFGQILEGFFLTPRLVGERIGLHPVAVIFGLLALGQLLGFVGVLIALPASAVLLVALRRGRTQYLASRLFSDQA